MSAGEHTLLVCRVSTEWWSEHDSEAVAVIDWNRYCNLFSSQQALRRFWLAFPL